MAERQDRRAHQTTDARLDGIEFYLEQLDQSVQQIKYKDSLRKNGETWKQYIGKIVTLDRILLIIVLIYQFGGQIQIYKSQLDGLVAREAELTKQQQSMNIQHANMDSMLSAQGGIVRELMGETDRLSQVSSAFDDRISRTVTRSEFNETVQQRIIPRLERIEQTLKVQ